MNMTHEARRAHLTETAVVMANTLGLSYVGHQNIADRCGVSVWLVRSHFPNKRTLWSIIADHSKASQDVRNEAILIGVK